MIDKAKEEEAVKQKITDKITQSSQKNSFATGLTLSQEDALRAQIFGCWSVPLGLPYDEDLLVRIKLQLKKDGTVMWHCPYKFDFFYAEIKDKDGEFVSSCFQEDFNIEMVPEEGSHEIKYYEGCPKHLTNRN